MLSSRFLLLIIGMLSYAPAMSAPSIAEPLAQAVKLAACDNYFVAMGKSSVLDKTQKDNVNYLRFNFLAKRSRIIQTFDKKELSDTSVFQAVNTLGAAEFRVFMDYVKNIADEDARHKEMSAFGDSCIEAVNK